MSATWNVQPSNVGGVAVSYTPNAVDLQQVNFFGQNGKNLGIFFDKDVRNTEGLPTPVTLQPHEIQAVAVRGYQPLNVGQHSLVGTQTLFPIASIAYGNTFTTKWGPNQTVPPVTVDLRDVIAKLNWRGVEGGYKAVYQPPVVNNNGQLVVPGQYVIPPNNVHHGTRAGSIIVRISSLPIQVSQSDIISDKESALLTNSIQTAVDAGIAGSARPADMRGSMQATTSLAFQAEMANFDENDLWERFTRDETTQAMIRYSGDVSKLNKGKPMVELPAEFAHRGNQEIFLRSGEATMINMFVQVIHIPHPAKQTISCCNTFEAMRAKSVAQYGEQQVQNYVLSEEGDQLGELTVDFSDHNIVIDPVAMGKAVDMPQLTGVSAYYDLDLCLKVKYSKLSPERYQGFLQEQINSLYK